jgi:KaiC/GvpD/RAD55 family RecA-like ATPase
MKGERCLYISLEESETSLKRHMRNFGWDPDGLEKKGLLCIKRLNTFKLTRDIEALVAKSKDRLLIEIEEEMKELVPKNFKPSFMFLDSITALEMAFEKRKEEHYRFYI